MGPSPPNGSFTDPDLLLPDPPALDASALPGSAASPYAPPAPDPDAPIRPWWAPVMKAMEITATFAWVFLCLTAVMVAVVIGMGGSVFLVFLLVLFFFLGRYAWRLRRELKSPSRRLP